jgi:hypothetical protein
MLPIVAIPPQRSGVRILDAVSTRPFLSAKGG